MVLKKPLRECQEIRRKVDATSVARTRIGVRRGQPAFQGGALILLITTIPPEQATVVGGFWGAA